MLTKLFPYDTVRDQQDILIEKVLATIDRGGQLLVHAPTGLGKTAATLAPAIERAITLNKVVIFMTSRLTQHALALETISRIQKKHNIAIPVVDLIGKKHFCLQPGVQNLGGKEFAEYCKAMREDALCDYYTRMKQGEHLSQHSKAVLVQLGKNTANTPQAVKSLCSEKEYQLCPYEITMLMSKDARVIIADYSYIFNASISESFFKRVNRELSDCVLIVDEGHNLPDRIKDIATERFSTRTIKRAVAEMQKMQQEDHKHHLTQVLELLHSLASGVADERYITKDELLVPIERICNVEQFTDDLEQIAKNVREEQKSSSCGAIADFLRLWAGADEGFVRILRIKEQSARSEERSSEEAQQTLSRKMLYTGSASRTTDVEITYRCLDPGVITKQVFDAAHSTVIMSGTLTPPEMYAEILGTSKPELLTLVSPFPSHNRINVIIPKTSTKYTTRSQVMYNNIAVICAEIANEIPGNSAIFFPSYGMLSQLKPLLEVKCHSTVLSEQQGFTKEEREELLDRFRSYKHASAVLLAVMGGSFSEGIDLPGDELRAVIVVGLPLARPDLETKALIDHYQRKFEKGWEYGYTFPAFNKTLQSAGRCIRTETDRGCIIFLDERYAWQNYYGCFPKEWNIKISLRYVDLIRQFFAEKAVLR